MSDLEYDILDQLYFLQHYSGILKNIEVSDEELKKALKLLIHKGWIKAYLSPSNPLVEEWLDFDLTTLYFLATKSGLLVHNGK